MIHNYSLYSKILNKFDKFHRQIAEKKAKKIAIDEFRDRPAIFSPNGDRRSPITHALIAFCQKCL